MHELLSFTMIATLYMGLAFRIFLRWTWWTFENTVAVMLVLMLSLYVVYRA